MYLSVAMLLMLMPAWQCCCVLRCFKTRMRVRAGGRMSKQVQTAMFAHGRSQCHNYAFLPPLAALAASASAKRSLCSLRVHVGFRGTSTADPPANVSCRYPKCRPECRTGNQSGDSRSIRLLVCKGKSGTGNQLQHTIPAASIFSRADVLNCSALMVSGKGSSPSPSTCHDTCTMVSRGSKLLLCIASCASVASGCQR